jgi:hypothetical protein
MADPARKFEAALPAEIADAMETAGIPAGMSKLMEIIAEYRRLKEAGPKSALAEAEPVEEMWPLQALLPVRASYQKSLRAARSGQLEAQKIGGRWFCTERAMHHWLTKTGQSKR